jgi:hypothetical protein
MVTIVLFLPPGAAKLDGSLRDRAPSGRDDIMRHLDEWQPTFADGWKGLSRAILPASHNSLATRGKARTPGCLKTEP